MIPWCRIYNGKLAIFIWSIMWSMFFYFKLSKSILKWKINNISVIFAQINKNWSLHAIQISFYFITIHTGCPKKHGNSVTNSISSLLWISIIIPNFKSHSIIMSVLCRVYFMKRARDCKDIVSARWTVKTDKITLSTAIFLFY